MTNAPVHGDRKPALVEQETASKCGSPAIPRRDNKDVAPKKRLPELTPFEG